MEWFILTLITVFSFSIFHLIRRLLMRDKGGDPLSYALIFQFLGFFMILFLLFFKGFIVPPIKEMPLNFILMTILYTLSSILGFKAMRTVQASEFPIFNSTSAIWTIFVAIIFLGESFDLLKIIGTLLILISILLLTYKGIQISFNKGSIYALIAAFCVGLAYANDFYILRRTDAISYLALLYLLPGIGILTYKPSLIRKIKKSLKYSIILKILSLSFLNAIGILSLYLAYQKGGNASQLAPIVQSSVILTAILAFIFIGERTNFIKKMLASILVSMGVLLLR